MQESAKEVSTISVIQVNKSGKIVENGECLVYTEA